MSNTQPAEQEPKVATTGDQQTTLARLAGELGINVARGTASLRGNATKYIALLGTFADSHAQDMCSLAASLARGDENAARRVVHGLKGTTGLLGLDHLAKTVLQLEATLLGNPPGSQREPAMRAGMEAFDIELAALAAVLATQSAQADAVAAAAVEPQKLRALLRQFDALLAQSDTSAMALFDEHAAMLRAAMGPAFGAFSAQIRKFDFAGARQTLKAFADSPAAGLG